MPVEQVRLIFDDTDDVWAEGEGQLELRGSAVLVRSFFDREWHFNSPQHVELGRIEVSAWTQYKMFYSSSTSIHDAVRSFEIAGQHTTVVNRKMRATPNKGVHVVEDASSSSILVVLEGGFPNGGECHADVHAPWGTIIERESIPKDGSVIFEIPKRVSRPRTAMSATTMQRILSFPDLFDSVAKFLPAVDILRASHTCRRWRRYRLLTGQDLRMTDIEAGQNDPPPVSLQLSKCEKGAKGKIRRWFTACVPRGVRVHGALVKLRLYGRGSSKQAWLAIDTHSRTCRQDPQSLIALARARHHSRVVKLCGSIPSAPQRPPQQSPPAHRCEWEAAFSVFYGVRGLHSLHVEAAEFAALVRM